LRPVTAERAFMMTARRALTLSVVTILCIGLVAGCGGGSSTVMARSQTSRPVAVKRVSGGATGSYVGSVGIHKIKHVIVIQQENRSFDSYFGTVSRC